MLRTSGPQFDPKDIDYLEVQSGGYSAEYGDRTYGVFNVVTRSGFERDRQAELVTSYGSFNRTEDQFSIGDHTDRFAYYGSVSGNRTDLGLETGSTDVLHDLGAGPERLYFPDFNKTPNDQLRLVASARGDHYQVPNDPDQQALGIRDVEDERDDLVNFSWLHTLNPGAVLTVSPFYHFNRAHYIGGYVGEPDPDVVIPKDDRGSNYFGGVASLAVNHGKHNARAGFQVFGARDNQLFRSCYQRWQQSAAQPARSRLGECRSAVSGGSVQAHQLADDQRRSSAYALRLDHQRKCG